jgi:hypothetical protein
MTPVSHVEDDEDLYRSIWPTGEDSHGLYVTYPDGSVRFGSQAFADRSRRPSVDRASLCDNDPVRARKHPSAGVTMVVAGKARAIGPLPKFDTKNRPVDWIQVDVEHVPIENDPAEPDNPAHAEIVTNPLCSKKEFRRLCEALALLANEVGWLVEINAN